ncbi:YceI family protein [Roseateles terrae]|uniref:Lipid/polyisoprenoid-binding YceI-like domain-containing protein n=1 Tax=Roseateles terrae TaxID=431060 RepID=A0ABR6GSC6_9BURK|nr:YceI family protein [Roseateles terrae]MBB3194038.1 hypothetical protein [Roseateles terrae]
MFIGLLASQAACTSTVPDTAGKTAATAGSDSGSASLASCGDWLRLQQAGEGRLYAFDPARSTLRILVYRGGRLASLGHNHVIAAEQHAVGQVYLPRDGLATAGAELSFRLDQLVLDAPAWRTAMGSDFAKILSEADIAGTRANMLKGLDAEQFPVVTAVTRTVEGGWPRLVLRLDVTLHGETRTLDMPVEAVRPEGEGPLKARGRLVLRQTDFGIQPFTVLGGLLAIQDPLTIEVDLSARPATACQPRTSA